MAYKIIIPETKEDPVIIEKRIKAMFSEDLEKNGILAKTLVLVYLKEQPVSVTELTKEMNQQYKKDYDRATVYRAMQKLTEKGLFFTATSGHILSLKPSERKEVHNQIIDKYHHFLDGVPEQFRRRFQDINFFWIANDDGLKYIEWCCKILGYKCEKTKDAN